MLAMDPTGRFLQEFLIILSTASPDTLVKSVIFGGSEGGLISFSVPERKNIPNFHNFVWEKRMQTDQLMTFQTHGMEVSLLKPYLGVCLAHAI